MSPSVLGERTTSSALRQRTSESSQASMRTPESAAFTPRTIQRAARPPVSFLGRPPASPWIAVSVRSPKRAQASWPAAYCGAWPTRLRPSSIAAAAASIGRRMVLLGAHVRIAEVPRRSERFLDAARGDPAQQVQDRPRLVVGAAGPGTAERLLAYHG